MAIRNTNTAMGKALAAAMGGGAQEEGGQNGEEAAAGGPGIRQNARRSRRVWTGKRSGSARPGTPCRTRRKWRRSLDIGEITLTDILKELEKPARDPREDMPAPILRSDVLDMKDLKPGMILKGTVRNVIDFGAFVDIGVHQDGLVHISQITDRLLSILWRQSAWADVVDVKVLDVDAGQEADFSHHAPGSGGEAEGQTEKVRREAPLRQERDMEKEQSDRGRNFLYPISRYAQLMTCRSLYLPGRRSLLQYFARRKPVLTEKQNCAVEGELDSGV